MEHLLGFTGLAIVALITIYLALRHPTLQLVLLVAFLARAGAALFQFYVGSLPDSGADAITFENRAWEWAQAGPIGLWKTYLRFDSYMISRLIGTLYALTDRSLLLAQSLSVGCGTGSVYLVYKISDRLWGTSAAKKAAWAAALFPTLVLYSALTMREAYIWFFFLLGLLGVAYWAGGKAKKGSALAVSGFTVATFFHGGMFIALLAFLALVGFWAAKNLVARLSAGFIRPALVFVVICSMIAIGSYAMGAFSVPKLGTIEQLTDTERILSRFERSSRDAASYPAWLVPDTLPEMIALVPARTVYFLYSPFPWDARGPKHLIGLADGLLYMVLTFFLWRNRRAIWRNRRSRAVFLVVLPVLLVYAIAIGNFGTGIRHRAKFVGGLILLAAPAIPRMLLKGNIAYRGGISKRAPVQKLFIVSQIRSPVSSIIRP